MAGRFNLKLRAHFFNKIGPFRRSRRVRDLAALGATADIDPHPRRIAR